MDLRPREVLRGMVHVLGPVERRRVRAENKLKRFQLEIIRGTGRPVGAPDRRTELSLTVRRLRRRNRSRFVREFRYNVSHQLSPVHNPTLPVTVLLCPPTLFGGSEGLTSESGEQLCTIGATRPDTRLPTPTPRRCRYLPYFGDSGNY